ncbi:hypothetical protein SDC9_205628 [bioreactor metagenome]|uniref:Uncharacterized protein n=1 Tax=bioreactor metagenome TaxID=1076179 RepID=A0A645J489_9ZZZZ
MASLSQQVPAGLAQCGSGCLNGDAMAMPRELRELQSFRGRARGCTKFARGKARPRTAAHGDIALQIGKRKSCFSVATKACAEQRVKGRVLLNLH